MSESGSKTAAAQDHPRSQYWPLYAAGFVTAFGAHSIAANLGAYGREHHAALLTVGLLLAIYDGAEVILKPVFGALVDCVGPRTGAAWRISRIRRCLSGIRRRRRPRTARCGEIRSRRGRRSVLPRGVYAGRPAHADRRPWSTVRQLRRMKGSRVHAGPVGRRCAGHTRRVHTAVLGSVRTGMLRCDVGRLGRTEGRTTASQAVHRH